MVFCSARKPRFFREEYPFYLVDQTQDNFRGAKITESSELKEDSSLTYLEGNSKALNDFLKVKLGKEMPKVAYFGDHYIGDAHWCSQIPGWDGIAIIEELSSLTEEYKQIEEASPLPPLDPKLVSHTKYWGENIFIHSS